MAFGFTDLTPEGKRYFQELKKLAEMEVVVGFQEGQAYEDGTSMAEVAAYNEFGSSDTPARPFMKQSLPITVDLFTNGIAVVDPDTDRTVAYEDNALDDMLSFADFLNSEHTVHWSHNHDVAIVIDGDVLNMTGLVNDNNYEYRSRLSVLFYFTQQAVEGAAVLSEDSIVYPTNDPENPYTPVEPVEAESPTGGYETDYIKKMEKSKVEPVYKPSASGGGSEELAQESVGYFNEAEIKEEKQ